MYRMTDIYIHIIPGVDDSPLNLTMSQQMLQIAQSEGIYKIFAASHSQSWLADPKAAWCKFRQLQEMSKARFPQFQLFPGCEVLCTSAFMPQIIQALQNHQLPTMNGTHWILMEFFPWERAAEFLTCVQALMDAGYSPILAHAKRYPFLMQENQKLVERFVNWAARFRLTPIV